MNSAVCDPQSLWIERTTLVLCRPLPGISRWFEVERREVVSVEIIIVRNILHNIHNMLVIKDVFNSREY